MWMKGCLREINDKTAVITKRRDDKACKYCELLFELAHDEVPGRYDVCYLVNITIWTESTKLTVPIE